MLCVLLSWVFGGGSGGVLPFYYYLFFNGTFYMPLALCLTGDTQWGVMPFDLQYVVISGLFKLLCSSQIMVSGIPCSGNSF